MLASSKVNWPLLWLAAAATTSCGVKPLADGSDDTQSSSGASTTKQTGVNCGTDPESGVKLCLGTSECPDVKLDADAFPSCGFHSTTKRYDIECVCNGTELCPVGVASSCDDIAGLFVHKSVADVCNQISDGACTPVARSAGSASPSAPGGTSSSCDRGCVADCEGSPPCVQACGC
jgi:hypothetical protein